MKKDQMERAIFHQADTIRDLGARITALELAIRELSAQLRLIEVQGDGGKFVLSRSHPCQPAWIPASSDDDPYKHYRVNAGGSE